LSLGHPVYESAATDPLVQAVEAAVRAGIVVVTAAGNCGINPETGLPGYGGIASPGNAPSAITVGSGNTKGTLSRVDDRVAGYSSRGPSWYDGLAKPDILAPGQAMISNEVAGSTLALEYPELSTTSGSSKFLKLNGSSMATGVVSGLAAIMLEANQWGAYARWSALQETLRRHDRYDFAGPPLLTPNAIKAMLQYSATPIADDNGARYDALTQGTGLVNGIGAIALAYYTDTTRTAGSFWLTTSVPPVSTFGEADATWSQSMIWGTRLVAGSSIVELSQAAWADNIVWGTGEMDNIVWGTVSEYADNIVWGTSLGSVDVVWAGNASWGDNIVWGTASWSDNIVWGTGLLGFFNGDNIVWGTLSEDNIVWGTLSDDNIVWGTNDNKVTILGSSLIGGGL
jgi:serine protease AprX